MKKHVAVKFLAFTLALLMLFSIPAFANEDDSPDAPTTIDLTVGEIYSLQTLVEALGGSYKTSIGNRNVSSVTCNGAIRCTDYTWPEGCGIYGAKVGQGSIVIKFYEGSTLEFSGFNVTAASDPIVKEASMTSSDTLSLVPLLEDEGYAAEDISFAVHWDVKTSMPLTILYGGCASYSTHGNGTAFSQVLFNMKDDQIILVNITVEDPKETWKEFGLKMLTPFAFFLTPIGWVFIPVAPLIILVQWILWLIEPLLPTKYHEATPALVF